MSESHTSSTSAATSIASDLPLDDAAPSPCVAKKSVRISEARWNSESDSVSRENSDFQKNGKVSCSGKSGAVAEPISKNECLGTGIGGLVEDVQKCESIAAQESENDVESTRQYIDHSLTTDKTKTAYVTKINKTENGDLPRVIMRESLKISEPPEVQISSTSNKGEESKMSVTPVPASVERGVESDMENKHDVLENPIDEAGNTFDRNYVARSFQKAEGSTSNKTLPIVSKWNSECNHRVASGTGTLDKASPISSGAPAICLLPPANTGFQNDRVASKIPDCGNARMLSESPLNSADSWKDATINMNIPYGDDDGSGLGSAYNTALRNHQTKIIYNNRTLKPGEVIHHHPLFVKDTSKYWYKPTISREEAINMLRDKPPGTFVVRDSNSFPGAFGLALKVATPPAGVHPGDGTELVRHFLIEPSPKGVKLKGCNNEPVFGTLSALVYQHSITPLALPIKLLLPDYDPASTPEHISAAQALLQQGAACNVTYVVSLDTESLTGPEAVRRCISEAFGLLKQKMIQSVSVHFKVSAQGVTITDNTRRLFFRRHYPVQSVTYAGLDPSDRRWDNSYLESSMAKYVKSARMFAFVARKIGSRTDNACHVFAELEPEQPATAVVNFITKVMMGRK